MTEVRPHVVPEAEVVWEVDPPAAATSTSLADQIDAINDVATSVLVPDNHTGRATVSSIAVARRVQEAGIDAVACLNARDRNLLGLRRDLLTCAFEGIDDLLLVYGDRPRQGSRASDLTVGQMLDECRGLVPHLRVGVTTRLTPVPGWKLEADRLFVQVSYDLDALRAWRDTIAFDGPVIPAVMVIPSVAMAQRLAARIPELRMPDPWLTAIATDPYAGTRLATDLAARILASGEFDGVHVVTGKNYRAAANRLRLNPRRTFDDPHRQPRLSSHGPRPRAEVGA